MPDIEFCSEEGVLSKWLLLPLFLIQHPVD